MIVLVALLGCTGAKDSAAPGSDPTAAISPVIESLGETVWLPRYAQLVDDAAALEGAIGSTCPSIEDARAAWWSAKATWKQSDALAFGPYTEAPRLGPQLDGWPTRPDLLQEILDSEDPIDTDAMGATSTGLPALGWVLHEADGLTARRCDLAAALAAKLSADAAEMSAAWSAADGMLASLVDPASDPGDSFEQSQDVLDEVFNRMVFAVENVRLIKLGKPAGLENGGTIDTSLLEAPHSGRSLEDARDNLRGVMQHWDGAYAGADGDGVVDLLPAGSRDRIDATVQAAYADAMAALGAVNAPLAETLYTEPEAIDAALNALLPLQVALQVEAAQALQVTIRFNDADGD